MAWMPDIQLTQMYPHHSGEGCGLDAMDLTQDHEHSENDHAIQQLLHYVLAI